MVSDTVGLAKFLATLVSVHFSAAVLWSRHRTVPWWAMERL